MAQSFLARHSGKFVAAGVVAVTWSLARLPELDPAERTQLASGFRFERAELPSIEGAQHNTRRPVNPSVEKIWAWISSVGAAVALADVDQDGLPNDVCYVETSTDRIIVAPVPGTPPRYEPFALVAPATPWPDSTNAPMGCLPADMNGDGHLDLLAYYWGRTPVAFLRKVQPPAPQAPLPAGEELPGDPSAAPAAEVVTPEVVAAPLSLGDFEARLVMPEERIYTDAASFADLDGDTHLDLLLANYFQDGSELLDPTSSTPIEMQLSMSRALNGGRNRILLNAGGTSGPSPDVSFTDASDVLSTDVAHGWSLAVGTGDLDGDLRPEIYFGNDFGQDRLLHNRSQPGKLDLALLEGRSSFTTPSSKVLGKDSFKGMGIDFADLNTDGHLDMFVSNIAAEYALQESHFLFVHTGDLEVMKAGIAPFEDHSERLGLARSSWAWEAKMADFNNDGVLEAVQATGFMRGERSRWPEMHEVAMGNDNLLTDTTFWPRLEEGDELCGNTHVPFYIRSSSGRYYDLAREVGLGELENSRAVATADVDGDGDLDFAVGNQWMPSSFYLNSCASCGNSVGLHLLWPVRGEEAAAFEVRSGHPGAGLRGRAAVGAQATVKLPDGRRLMAQVDGGNGHSGERSPDLLFGLGEVTSPVDVELRWRDASGQLREKTVQLGPGWHTVLLGAL